MPLPFGRLESLFGDRIRFLVLHETDGWWGSLESIHADHLAKGWSGIGYHFLITNCFPTYEALRDHRPDPSWDGRVHEGRPMSMRGAHVAGWNGKSLGIAMVGRDGIFTGRQLEAAIELCKKLIPRFVKLERVVGHNETGAPKDCPELNMDWFRAQIGMTS